MKLYEIEKEKIITITAKNEKGASLSFKTETAFSVNELLFVQPVRKGDSVLDFSRKEVQVSVTYASDEGTVTEWAGCAVKNVTYQQALYTVMYAAEEGKAINRRNNYRQFLYYDGVMQLGKNRRELEVKVRDISVMGVGIIMEEEHELKDMGVINLEFQDQEFDIPIQVYADPVRKEKLDDKRTAYGCRIVQSETNLGRYLAAKQKSEACRVHGTYFDNKKFLHDGNRMTKE